MPTLVHVADGGQISKSLAARAVAASGARSELSIDPGMRAGGVGDQNV